MEGVDWNNVSIPDGHSASVDELWDHFKTSFVLVADRHAPIIQKRVRGVDNCPWLNKTIKSSMRHRDYLLAKARKRNQSEDWANYRRFRNQVSNSIKKAKAAYNRRLIDECGNDHKAFWRTMKKILPGEKKAVSPSIKTGETLSTDKKCIASSFNKFFTSAATRLVDRLYAV